MGDVPHGNGNLSSAKLVSLPPQFRTLAAELEGLGSLDGGHWPQQAQSQQMPAQLPDAARSQPAIGWPRAPSAQEVSQLLPAWMANTAAQQQASKYQQANYSQSSALGGQQLLSGYLDAPYFDITSLNRLSSDSPLYSTPSVHTFQGTSHSAPSNVQQPAMQNRQSAADHLLSQLVNDAANRLQNGGMSSFNGCGGTLGFLSNGNNSLGSGGHLQILSNQMAALSLPNSSSMPPQHLQLQQPQQPKPHQQRQQQSHQLHPVLQHEQPASAVVQQLRAQQSTSLETMMLETDQDAYGSLSGPSNVQVDVASSGSLGHVATAAAAAEPAPAPVNSASLYVKNLSPDTDELYLYQKFAPHGALLSCKVKTDPTTGKCRGVGFVNYVDQACAARAMQQLHGSRTAEGRQLHITLQAPRAVRAAAAAAATAPAVPGGSPRASTSTTTQQIHDLMQQSLR